MSNAATIRRHAETLIRHAEKRGWTVEAHDWAGSGESHYITFCAALDPKISYEDAVFDHLPTTEPLTVRISTHSPFAAKNGTSDFYCHPPQSGWREALAWLEAARKGA